MNAQAASVDPIASNACFAASISAAPERSVPPPAPAGAHARPCWWRRSLRRLGWALASLLAAAVQAEPTRFELNAPQARSVFLAGEMTNWEAGKLPMTRGDDGRWRVDVELGRGEWVYKFIVDGRWTADPAPTALRDSDGRGGEHSMLFVGEGDWSLRPGAPAGRVETHQVPALAWGRTMKVDVYLPPSYRAGEELPVLWLLHGAGMDADQWLKTGHIARYMNNLLAREAIRPFVIVMPSSGDVPYDGISERFITDELPVWLAARFGLHTVRARAGVAGMSMGGTGAVRLPLKRPELYGFGFALSGAFPDALVAALPPGPDLPMQVTLLCGSDDELVGSNRRLAKALRDRGARFRYLEEPGGHTWQYWSQHSSEMLRAADAFFRTGRLP